MRRCTTSRSLATSVYFVVAAIAFTVLVRGAQSNTSDAAASTYRDLPASALREVTPPGYKVEKTIDCGPGQVDQHEYLVAVSDIDDSRIAAKPIVLLLIAAGKTIVVEDRVTPRNTANTGKFWDGPPNYFTGITRENMGGRDLFLVRSVLSGAAQEAFTFSTSMNSSRRRFAW
jgi:hypothetical protein